MLVSTSIRGRFPGSREGAWAREGAMGERQSATSRQVKLTQEKSNAAVQGSAADRDHRRRWYSQHGKQMNVIWTLRPNA